MIDPSDVREHMADVERRVPRAEMFGRRLREITTFLTKEPRYYLHFGPYWWVLKDIIRRHIGGQRMVRWMGDADDLDVRRRYQTGDDWYDLCACLLFQAEQSGNLVDAPQRHQISDATGEDTETYELYDRDMHKG